jgi:hypothetical protein
MGLKTSERTIAIVVTLPGILALYVRISKEMYC